MATLDTSRPHWSAWLWHDGTAIFIQLPESLHIERFPKTEAGLRQALRLVEPCRVLHKPTSQISEGVRAAARIAIATIGRKDD